MKINRGLVLLVVLALSSLNLKAQESETRLDSIIDEMLGDDKSLYDLFDGSIKFHFLYFNASYSDQTTFAGRELGDNLYNFSGQLYYFISNGFYLGASGVWYSQMDPGYRTTALTLGYSNGTKMLRYRMSYNRYISTIPDYEPNYSNALNLGTTFMYNIVGARADYSFLFGREYDNQISFDLFSKIKLISLGGYDKIRFDPEISFYFGSEIVETDVGTGDMDDPFYIPDYRQNEVFGLMNSQIQLPLSIFYKDFMFEVSYSYNIPRSLDRNYEYRNTHSFKISLGYILSLN